MRREWQLAATWRNDAAPIVFYLRAPAYLCACFELKILDLFTNDANIYVVFGKGGVYI